jgi:hypothetical protein
MLVGVLVVLSARAQSEPASAKGGGIPSGDYIQAEIKGQFSTAGGSGGEHTGYQISASAVTWEVDAFANKTLLQMAEQLDGKLAIARGTYAERRGGSRMRRILTAQTLGPEAEKGRGEYIEVTVLGTLKSGVIAIGAETTGVTITANAVTWELELNGNQHQVASKLSGSKAIVSGRLRREAGVEVKNRFIVKVRNIQVGDAVDRKLGVGKSKASQGGGSRIYLATASRKVTPVTRDSLRPIARRARAGPERIRRGNATADTS